MSVNRKKVVRGCSPKHRDCLIRALIILGFKPEHIEVSETPRQLYGYDGKARKGHRAHVVIRQHYVGHASNDLGFEDTGDEYTMHVSDFDARIDPSNSAIGRSYDDAFRSALLHHYAVALAEKTMKASGYKLREATALSEKAKPAVRMVWVKA
jgi:hypothetical protein